MKLQIMKGFEAMGWSALTSALSSYTITALLEFFAKAFESVGNLVLCKYKDVIVSLPKSYLQ